MGVKLLQLKDWLKTAAIEIRITNILYKDLQRNHKVSYHTLWDLQKLQKEYRHKHIAYSELRGKTRAQIENPRQGNEPDEYLIQSIKDEHKEETLCASA